MSKRSKLNTPNIPVGSAAIVDVGQDTIPGKAGFKIKLVKDTVNYDETAFVFDHKEILKKYLSTVSNPW